MTNTKAQVGDLIRVISVDSGNYHHGFSGASYEIGEVLEVTERKLRGDGDDDCDFVVTKNDCRLYDREYVIHCKAGEEDSPYDTLVAQGHRGIEQFQAEIYEGESVVPAQSDAVNSPQHYTQGRVEVIDIIEDAVEGADPFEAVCQANILKYTLRYRAKNGVTDLLKAKWYLERLVAHIEK